MLVAVGILTLYQAVTAPELPADLPVPVRTALLERMRSGELRGPVQLQRVWLARDGHVWYRLRVTVAAGPNLLRSWTHAVYEPATQEVNWVDWVGGD